ncbi:MAG TPA: phosphonate metabolism protein/1,5-bisphosphokinase (PRPP-forming) PhnN [Burkholderiaceae bacterium]
MNGIALPPIPGAHRLIVVVGPSGAGKDSLLRGWRASPGVDAPRVAQRVITRAPDVSETHEAVTPAAFAGLRARGLLATWWQAHGLDYGVRGGELAPLADGRWVVLNGSRAHLPALRAQAPGLRVVAVSAPAHVLASRLAARGREGAPARAQRLAREIGPPLDADLAIVNDGDLRHAVDALSHWWRGQHGRD